MRWVRFYQRAAQKQAYPYLEREKGRRGILLAFALKNG
jgi:hypothetical protein